MRVFVMGEATLWASKFGPGAQYCAPGKSRAVCNCMCVRVSVSVSYLCACLSVRITSILPVSLSSVLLLCDLCSSKHSWSWNEQTQNSHEGTDRTQG